MNLLFVAFEGVMEGLDQFVDRLLTLSEISLRLGMQHLKRGPCQLQEGLIVGFQGFARKRLERFHQLLPCLGKKGLLLLQALQATCRPETGQQRPEQKAGHEPHREGGHVSHLTCHTSLPASLKTEGGARREHWVGKICAWVREL